MRLPKKLRGFTLIELLVAISVLALILSVAMVSFGEVQKQARNRKRQIDLHLIATALEGYYADHGFYPITNKQLSYPAQFETAGEYMQLDKIACLLGGTVAAGMLPRANDFTCTLNSELSPPRPIPPPYNVYLANGDPSQVPKDPLNQVAYTYASDGQTYTLVTRCYEGTAPIENRFSSSNPYYNEAKKWSGNSENTGCESSKWSDQFYLSNPAR